MRNGEIEIRIPESIPLEQGGFSPHYPAVCGLCPFAMDTHLSWTKWHNMPASTMTAWTTLRKVSAFTLFTTGMESRSPSTAKGHAEKHIVGYFRSVEAGRGLHGAGDQNAQKEVDAW